MRRPIVLVLVGLVGTLSAIGCSSSDDSGASAETSTAEAATEVSTPSENANMPLGGVNVAEVDACALLSADEIGAVLGVAVQPTTGLPPVVCKFTTTDDLQAATVMVDIYPSADFARDEFESTIALNGYEEVANLGERAYVWALFGVPAGVAALSGPLHLSVDVNALSDAQAGDALLDDEIALVRAALERLP